MKYKILVFNLGGLSENDERFNLLVDSISKLSPDFVLLQEVRRYKNKKNILSNLKSLLGFPHSNFTETFDFSIDYGKGVFQSESMKEGLGVLSKFKFNLQKTVLPIIKGKDRWPRIAVCYDFGNFFICNLHLSKYDDSRKLEMEKLPNADVYAGDFNMFPEEIKKYFQGDKISFDFKKYISFPSKNMTLDYVVLKRGKFIKVESIDKTISDHTALFVIVEI